MKIYGLLGLTVAALLSACGGDDGGSGGGGGSTTGQGGGGTGGGAMSCDPAAAPEVTDVTGRWAMLVVGAQLVQAPGFVEPIGNRIISVLLVTQTQAGDAVSMSAEYCDHDTESDEVLAGAAIPDAYRDSLQPVTRTGTFAEGTGGRRYHLDTLVEVAGASITDATSPLPTDPTDPLVTDQDMDGNPGITIELTGLSGSVYAVERRITEMNGVAVSADRIEGLVTFSSEQSVLGADPASIADTVAMTQRSTDPDTCHSYFTMVRVADTDDCVAINAQGRALFE